jgi:hypothetical protein
MTAWELGTFIGNFLNKFLNQVQKDDLFSGKSELRYCHLAPLTWEMMEGENA